MGASSIINKVSPVLLKGDMVENLEDSCRLIVQFADGRGMDHVMSMVDSNQGRMHREIKLIRGVAVELPYIAIRELMLSRNVRRIWHDAEVRAALDVAAPLVGSKLAREQGFTGKGITVGVIDTGIAQHADLTRPDNRIVGWKDLVDGQEAPYDDNGHGTHVSGIIAGNGYASRGKYVGMAPEANLVGIKALDRQGSGTTSNVLAAIEWCIDHQSEYNIRVINMSLGSAATESYRQDLLCQATSAAWDKGILVCCAAGNDGPKVRTINTPGINPKIITVGNLDDRDTLNIEDDQLSQSSSRGPTVDNINKPDILAPGTDIVSLSNRGRYRSLTGTSMATPMVAGAAAQILQKSPEYKPDQLKKLLIGKARTLDLKSTEQGAGVLNMEKIFAEKESDQKKRSDFDMNAEKMFPAALLMLGMLMV